MKYMLLFCDQPSGGINEIPPDEMEEYGELREEILANGVFVSGVALDSTERGVRVRVTDGEPVTADGPFAEITDLLSGFFVIDVPDRAAAIALAARIPAARNGAIEIRRVFDTENV